ncbi:MAG: hypothetical protein JSW61_11005 [Candidatus Thorarchaeota archaeon]|nr:MAG: hypothetical protein JSW61_11005 [Candidatus Thorarchaeota archaeon]
MKRPWSLLVLTIVFWSFMPAPVQAFRLEGRMVGVYGAFVNEYWDGDDPNNVTLELSIGMNGINEDSPYYNCGITERLKAARMEVPDQGLIATNQLGWTVAHSNLSSMYQPPPGERWYPFLLAFLTNFSLTTRPGDNLISFTVECGTLIVNDSGYFTVTESASFDYLIHIESNGMNGLSPTAISIGVSSVVIVILAVVELKRRRA